jgi:hypothetical protein
VSVYNTLIMYSIKRMTKNTKYAGHVVVLVIIQRPVTYSASAVDKEVQRRKGQPEYD